MNKIERRKTIEKINQNKSQFFEKINKTETFNKTMEKRERTQINKIKNEGHIIIYTAVIQRVIRSSSE